MAKRPAVVLLALWMPLAGTGTSPPTVMLLKVIPCEAGKSPVRLKTETVCLDMRNWVGVSEEAVLSARVAKDEQRRSIVWLTLATRAADTLRKWTSENIGNRIVYVFKGNLFGPATIESMIPSRISTEVPIQVDYTLAQAERLARPFNEPGRSANEGAGAMIGTAGTYNLYFVLQWLWQAGILVTLAFLVAAIWRVSATFQDIARTLRRMEERRTSDEVPRYPEAQ